MLVDGPAAARARRGGPLSNRLERAMQPPEDQQLLLLLAAQVFLLRRLIGVPMRESLGAVAVAVACSAVLVLAIRNNPQQV
jgi:hypothetical protein